MGITTSKEWLYASGPGFLQRQNPSRQLRLASALLENFAMKGKTTKDVIHRARRALIIIDMMNRFEFPGGAKLRTRAKRAALQIAKLKKRAVDQRLPVIYVNDNFGQWRSDWEQVFATCREDKSPGKEIAAILKPGKSDYFVLKPKHSAFFATTLEVLLAQIGVKELILTGVAADICILFSAHDAHVRGYEITVPEDCVAAELPQQKLQALQLMKKVFKIKSGKGSSVPL